jgi:hypothetical protein
MLKLFVLIAVLANVNSFGVKPSSLATSKCRRHFYMTSLEDPRIVKEELAKRASGESGCPMHATAHAAGAAEGVAVTGCPMHAVGGHVPAPAEDARLYDGAQYESRKDYDVWEGNMDGFDWQLEQARRLLEGPGFAPLRMTLWKPEEGQKEKPPPGFWDHTKILVNNALQMVGLADSIDGAPVVQGVNTFKGDPLHLVSRILDGDLQELAGGPLFLLLQDYYKKYGPVYKLAFGPKSFIVVSDPVMVKHILKDNPTNYDKGILAEILEPVMGKGLIPADPKTWRIRRKAIVPGFHKAWLNAMVSSCHRNVHICRFDSTVGEAPITAVALTPSFLRIYLSLR